MASPTVSAAAEQLVHAVASLASALGASAGVSQLGDAWRVLAAVACAYALYSLVIGLLHPTPKVVVPLGEDVEPALSGAKFDTATLAKQPSVVHCWDPSTMDVLGEPLPVMNEKAVAAAVARARAAQRTWAGSSFDARRKLLRTMLRFIVEVREETHARCA